MSSAPPGITPDDPSATGGTLGGGTLSGTNGLQTAIDALTNQLYRMNSGGGGGNSGGSWNWGGGNASGYSGGGFPPMINPFNNSMPGYSGAGVYGAGMAVGSVNAYGQSQLTNQLGLDAYVRQSQLGMTMNAGYSTTMLRTQAFGMYGVGLNAIASSPMDALAMTQQLQFLGGNPLYNSTQLGRAGFGATASFGLTNPTLSGSQSASLAQQIFSPQFSQQMIALGYGVSPRALGGGRVSNIGTIMQAILRGWYNKNSVAPSSLYSSLSQGGRGYANLSALGLDPTQTAPLLEGYNQLFNAGLSPTQATNLFKTAAFQNQAGASARARLSSLGVTTAKSDIQEIKNAQSVVTGRLSNTADGFNTGLRTATALLVHFNTALSDTMTGLGLNGPVGFAGGFSGIMSGTSHGPGLLGIGGLLLLGRALGGGGGLAGLFGGGSGAAAAGGAAGGGAGSLAALGPIGLGIGAGLGLNWLNNKAMSKDAFARTIGTALQQTGNPTLGATGGLGAWILQHLGIGGSGSGIYNPVMFGQGHQGGPSGVAPQTKQSKNGSGNSMPMGITTQAINAVNAAEGEIGVPYQWGGSSPKTGFDCSGLVEWAYKQAGVNIPRTSQAQWAALKNRAINMNSVQEGDLVFMAGADGTPNNPGHVGMMINRHQLIQSPQPGEKVQIIGYDPSQWSHAARPTGSLLGSAASAGNSGLAGTGSVPPWVGNSGVGMGSGAGTYGSVNELDALSGILGGVAGGGNSFLVTSSNTTTQTAANPGRSGGSLGTGSGTPIPKNSPNPPNGSGNTVAVDLQLGKRDASVRGWGSGQEWQSLYNLWMAESAWEWWAANSSGAYGIPQALPGSKMGSFAQGGGPDWKTNPETQIQWGLHYIKQVYGDPNKAWAHEQQFHNYATGTSSTLPGMAMVGERGPELIMTGSGNTVLSNAQSMAIMKAMNTDPAQSPWNSNMFSPYTGTSSGQSPQICVNFNKGSIVMSSTGDIKSDASAAGREVVRAIVKRIQSEDMYNAIAEGNKH